MRPRRGRSRSAALVALLGLGLAVSVVVDVLRKRDGRSTLLWDQGEITDRLVSTQWSDDAVLATAVGLLAAGGLLLLWALLPGRRAQAALSSPDELLVLGMDHRSVRTVLARAATSVDGVQEATVRVRLRRARVVATTSLRDPSGLQEGVRAAVEDRARALGLAPQPTVRARIKVAR